MAADNWTTCKCNHCDGNIEFEAHNAGTTVVCPHCGLETSLFEPNSGKKEHDSGPGTIIGKCDHCEGKLRFKASKIGQIINCPHCGKSTTLFEFKPPSQPTDYASYAPYTVREECPKLIEEKLDLLASIVLGFGILSAIVCIVAGFNAEDAAVMEKVVWIGVGVLLGFLGWVGMLFLNGFAEIIRLLRANGKK